MHKSLLSSQMKKLLVPINFNADYQNVLNYALSIAQKSRAEITLFYVSGRRFLKGHQTLAFQPGNDLNNFQEALPSNALGQAIQRAVDLFMEENVNFTLQVTHGNFIKRVTDMCASTTYDLILLGTDQPSGMRGFLRNNPANELLKVVNTPVFVVPAASDFVALDHITYAADLSDYDPKVIRQVKAIAALFDAKLSILHVNQKEENKDNSTYINSLEQTITDTLDYPKVNYQFFDHEDILSGIQKSVKLNKSKLVAMVNRHETNWRDSFRSPKSLTHKMAQDLNVPLLAFKK